MPKEDVCAYGPVKKKNKIFVRFKERERERELKN